MTISGNRSNMAAPVYGLVLAGGKSTRMGTDKGLLNWRGLPHRLFLAKELSKLCNQVYLSCRPDQFEEMATTEYPIIADSFEGAGPIVAILSAMQAHPHVAWLVIACDLPLMDGTGLQKLLESRNPAMIATCYISPEDGLPEPLAAIWEPASHTALMTSFADGRKCPRKVLINSELHIQKVVPGSLEILLNANTPEEAQKARNWIASASKS